ncbi:hypothetical protein HOT42_gp91 [Microbacterium phage Metamorphoo]|uniref:Uncharacterized protein n=1 Tax=Microbacterium phage Metamorphoo TaxID=2201437 RepID=A0A2Z4Q661_9CAUD|nr:hypothetical protein HOT42_gp91 [Microbacterium phage Metamorphoo]AWY05440.1 hypothetical protein SEA_METAMORPHOO_90 [Microbacterium phage Metamorphoo]
MATLHETTPNPSAADPTAALAGLTARLNANRLGKSMFREMDRDLLAMRAAADALTALLDSQRRVEALIAEHERREQHNESVPLNRLSDLQPEPRASEYRAALTGDDHE